MTDLNIIYQDEYFLVVDKPPGLVTTPSETQKEDTLADILQKDYKIELDRGGIVHRLDKDTSGLLLVAKTQEAFENLQAQFKSREVHKQYLALVHGTVEKSGVVEGAIARNPGNRENFIVDDSLENAREAVTRYEPVEKFKVQSEKLKVWFTEFNKIQMRKLERSNYGEFTLLRCFPLTGRTHQIRVHLKYIGHSIVADEKYGGRKTYRLDHRWCPRQFLHAAKIEFKHPVTGNRMEFDSPLPKDLEESLSMLKSF